MPEVGVTASRRIPFRFVENRVRKEYSDRDSNYRRGTHGEENHAQCQRQSRRHRGGRPAYPILTFPDVPEVQIELIDRPNERPWGAGEPTAAAVPSAISNAVFDAIGVRLRSVSFVPQKVLAGLKAV